MTTPFRLSTLLKLRQQQRDAASLAVSEALAAIEQIENKLREIEHQMQSMERLRREAAQGAMRLGPILDAQRFQIALTTQAVGLQKNLALLQQELQRRQQRLLKCQQNVKSLEKLQQRHGQEADAASMKHLQSQLDEWAQTRTATLPENCT